MTAPLRLVVAYFDGEYERTRFPGAVTSPEHADTILATIPSWREAMLRATEGATKRILYRRLPASPWREVATWPEEATRETMRSAKVDIDGIAAWLRAAGVSLSWRRITQPFPGHERGRIHAATALSTDRQLRHCRDRGDDALACVVAEIVAEGQEHGALLERERSRADLAERMMELARTELDRLRAEVERLRAAIATDPK